MRAAHVKTISAPNFLKIANAHETIDQSVVYHIKQKPKQSDEQHAVPIYFYQRMPSVNVASNSMSLLILLMAVLLVVVGVLLADDIRKVWRAVNTWRWRRVFKPISNLDEAAPTTFRRFSMRAAADNAGDFPGVTRTGRICFVTGTSREDCPCADCRSRMRRR